MAFDKQKDQSYFLYNLIQKQLAHILFPVGDYTKKEVVGMAKKWGLPVAARPESQEICFFPETDYRPFLQRQIPERIKEGLVVDSKGKIIGRHYGLPLYTIGQRHGFKVKLKIKNEKLKIILPYYVVGKNTKSNRLIVGFGKEAERKEFWVGKVNWVNPELKIFVRIRHQGELLKCEVRSEKWEVGREVGSLSRVKSRNEKWVKVVLEEPEQGIAPGQAAVFYSPTTNHQSLVTDFEVLGGGIIADYPRCQ
jgi:tRNA-specific 2-thiouridylase